MSHSFSPSFKIRLSESGDPGGHLTLTLKGNRVRSKVVLDKGLYNLCSQLSQSSVSWYPFLLKFAFHHCHIIIGFWCRFEIMKYSSQIFKLLDLSACLCSRKRANECDFCSPLGLASCWQTIRENWVSSNPLKAFK